MENKFKPDLFGGFEALSDSLTGTPSFKETEPDIPEVEDVKDILKDVDAEDAKVRNKRLADEDDEDDEEVHPVKKQAPKKVTEPIEDEDEEEEEEHVDDIIKKHKKPEPADELDMGEFEPDVAGFFHQKLADELGWELDEEDKFKSVKELVDYMKEVVEESSKPVYATPEIEKLNEYVANGGRLEDYYKASRPGSIDPDKIDTTSETDLKLAIREKLALQGYNEDRIKKMLSRYEDSDIIQDEGEDAVEFLKEYKTTQKERLLEQQKKQAEDSRKQQQKFYSTVETSVKNLENIRGIKISGKDKQELLDYIFKPDSEGVTKYQREYMADVKNLIESAYFTKQGDKLLAAAKQSGSTDAYKDLHQKLKASKGKRSAGASSQEESDDSNSLSDLLGKHLIRR